MPASVAIIMRSKNEMPHVHRALDMLGRQTFTDFELHAVDSGSTDGSLDELRAHCGNLVQIAPNDYVPGWVLNEAIARTAQDLIVLLNADAIPLADDWLETLLRPILEHQAEITFSRQVARPDARFIVTYDYERTYDPDQVGEGFFSAVACAFRRELWEKHRFREHGYAEDAAWATECIASGARIQLVEGAVIEHSHNYTLRELFTKRYRQALTFEDHPSAPKQLMLCLREILRDWAYAVRKLKVHTVPYNIAYRTTIHRAIYRGLKDQ